MDVKAAVKLAKEHVLDLFAEENITNLGLEEVAFEDGGETGAEGCWVVTLGFSRPWDEPSNTLASLARSLTPNRSYKIIRILDESGEVTEIKNREVSA